VVRGTAVVFVLLAFVSFALGLVLLDASGAGERARADRLVAAAQLEIARADAAAVRAAADRASAEQAHRHAMELVPVVVAVVGGLLLAALVLFLVWDVRCERRAAAAALPVVRVLVLPVVMSGESRADYWRSVSAAAAQVLALHPGDDVGIYPGGGDGR